MNPKVTELRRSPLPANAEAADPCQRIAPSDDAGRRSRLLPAGHGPVTRQEQAREARGIRATFSAATPGGPAKARLSSTPRNQRGTYPSRAGLAVGMVLCFAVFLAGVIALVLS